MLFRPNKLREVRARYGLTAQRLGEMLGVTKQAVTQWERGVSAPREGIAVALYSILGDDAPLVFVDIGDKT